MQRADDSRREVPTRERQTICNDRNSCRTLCRCSPPFSPSSLAILNACVHVRMLPMREQIESDEPPESQPKSTNRNSQSSPLLPPRPSFDVADSPKRPARTPGHYQASELHPISSISTRSNSENDEPERLPVRSLYWSDGR